MNRFRQCDCASRGPYWSIVEVRLLRWLAPPHAVRRDYRTHAQVGQPLDAEDAESVAFCSLIC